MEIEVVKRVGDNTHHYQRISINLIAYKCKFISGNYNLTDHDKYAWVEERELSDFNFSEVDIPLIKLLL